MSIETSSVDIHIRNSTLAYDKFKSEKYKSTSSISYVKGLINGFDKFWGTLSKIAVHTNILQGAKENNERFSSCSTPFLNIGNKGFNPALDQYILLNSKISGYIIYRCFQLLVAKDLSSEDLNKLSIESGLTEAKLNKLFKEFRFYKL